MERDRTANPHWAAVLDAQRLYDAVVARRAELGLTTWIDVCYDSGTRSPSMFSRLKDGHFPDAQNLARLVLWLGGTDLKPYLREAPDA